MSHPPSLSDEQRRAALLKAAESRRKRAEFKGEIKSGRIRWYEAFDHSDEAIRKMRVSELISSLPGFGSVRAENVLERAGISKSRRVQGIGKHQRHLLMELIGGR